MSILLKNQGSSKLIAKKLALEILADYKLSEGKSILPSLEIYNLGKQTMDLYKFNSVDCMLYTVYDKNSTYVCLLADLCEALESNGLYLTANEDYSKDGTFKLVHEGDVVISTNILDIYKAAITDSDEIIAKLTETAKGYNNFSLIFTQGLGEYCSSSNGMLVKIADLIKPEDHS